MQTNEELLATIENYLAQTDFPAEPELLYAPIGYSLGGGGKRLRPMLVMLSCGIFSDQIQSALPAAAAVEMFHNFTLLHDDIMDNAAMRRGKPSVFARWGQNVAILSGDAMLICAYRLLSGVPAHLLPQILATFNQMALEVCEGQQYDMDFEQKQKVSVVEYMHMIELKTSVLLAGSAVIGATLGGASEEDCRKLRRFAVELGLAFQLQDDLLDSYGDERLGKAIGGDILEGKKTYLMVTAMSRADEATREILRHTYRDATLTDAEKIEMCRVVSESGADYIKTSTGFGGGGATREDVALFKAHVAPHVKIKAAGGIADLQDAEDFVNLGADRLGTSRIVKAMEQK